MRFTIELSQSDMSRVTRLAAIKNLSATDSVLSALAMDEFLRDQVMAGGKLLIEKSDGHVYELVFK